MDDREQKPPNPILLEKQAMFAKQASRNEHDKPLKGSQQAAFGRALLARLDQSARPLGPARVTMACAGVLEHDRIPGSTDPEPIGGCFSDLIDDRNEGAHEKEEIETEDAHEDEEPFG